MTDVREQIIDRVFVICQGITGAKTIERNKTSISDVALPAIIVFDGDEGAIDDDPLRRTPASVRRVSMHPLIFIKIQDTTADVGQTLNGFRALLLKAIMEDTALEELSLDGVGIRYDGCSSAVEMGRKMTGEMRIDFRIMYQLRADLL